MTTNQKTNEFTKLLATVGYEYKVVRGEVHVSGVTVSRFVFAKAEKCGFRCEGVYPSLLEGFTQVVVVFTEVRS